MTKGDYQTATEPNLIRLIIAANDEVSAARHILSMPASCKNGGAGVGNGFRRGGGAGKEFFVSADLIAAPELVASMEEMRALACRRPKDVAGGKKGVKEQASFAGGRQAGKDLQESLRAVPYWDSLFRFEAYALATDGMTAFDLHVRLVSAQHELDDADPARRKEQVQAHFEAMRETYRPEAEAPQFLLGAFDYSDDERIAQDRLAQLLKEALEWDWEEAAAVGAVVLGLERELAWVEPGAKHRNKFAAGMDAEFSKNALHHALSRMPHLADALRVAHHRGVESFRVSAPIVPGFDPVNGYLNYDLVTNDWIEGVEDLLAERSRTVPLRAADPVISLYFDVQSQFQLAPREWVAFEESRMRAAA